MGTANINYIHKEFMTRLYSRNVPYHSVQKILSSHFLPKNYNIQNAILPVAPHGSGFHPTHTRNDTD
jgi:hypothetical protein